MKNIASFLQKMLSSRLLLNLFLKNKKSASTSFQQTNKNKSKQKAKLQITV